MADSGSGISQATQEVVQAAGEVAKDVRDSAGEAIEQGIQSVVGTTPTPQQIQPASTQRGEQKQLEDQKKLAETRRVIEHYKRVDTEQRKVRQHIKQKEAQKQQEEQQEQMKEIKQRQIQMEVKKPITLREDIARTQAERGKGRGVGG